LRSWSGTPGRKESALRRHAAGRLDAYFEVSRSPWDSAAGELLVREAGGAVTWTEQTEIVASGRLVHAPLIALLRAAHENSG